MNLKRIRRKNKTKKVNKSRLLVFWTDTGYFVNLQKKQPKL